MSERLPTQCTCKPPMGDECRQFGLTGLQSNTSTRMPATTLDSATATVIADSAMASTQAQSTTQSTTQSSFQTNSANSSASSNPTANNVQPPSTISTALIGGIAGGAAGLVCVICAIVGAIIVARRRLRDRPSAPPVSATPVGHSQYDLIPSPTSESDYAFGELQTMRIQ
jgi:hypothetical protein